MSPSHLRFLLAFVACVAVLAAPSLALGAAQRTFVKSTGVDTLPGPVPNACSLASPCRTFDAAMLQTLPRGEVIVLDSAGYGAVTIAQSVSIIAPPGVYAGITAASGDGVTVQGAGIVVVLQGLTINGLGTGGAGIAFILGNELHVINGSISSFGYGIAATAFGGRLFVSDTTIRGNSIGVAVAPGAKTAVFEHVRVEGSTIAGPSAAISVEDDAAVSIHGSVVSNNNGIGVSGIQRGSGRLRITVDDTLIADNASWGATIGIDDPATGVGTLDVIRSTLTRNSYGTVVISYCPCTSSVVMTVVSSTVTENMYGISSQKLWPAGNATAFVSGNAIAGNVFGGIESSIGVAHTRSNNAGEQTVPTSGTVTAVPGF